MIKINRICRIKFISTPLPLIRPIINKMALTRIISTTPPIFHNNRGPSDNLDTPTLDLIRINKEFNNKTKILCPKDFKTKRGKTIKNLIIIIIKNKGKSREKYLITKIDVIINNNYNNNNNKINF